MAISDIGFRIADLQFARFRFLLALILEFALELALEYEFPVFPISLAFSFSPVLCAFVLPILPAYPVLPVSPILFAFGFPSPPPLFMDDE